VVDAAAGVLSANGIKTAEKYICTSSMQRDRYAERGLVVELWLVNLLGADQQQHIGDGEHSNDIKNDWLHP
jgi:hypothetical protein